MTVQPVVVILGPTAVGKSELSLNLAEQFQTEIINADSMQLYQGMDIGTAKLPPIERRGIKHHLLDVYPVTQTVNVASYQEQARAVVSSLRAEQQVPIVVGGSGLYITALLEDLKFPATDEFIRAALEQRLEIEGAEVLHAELRVLDHITAEKIPVSNGRRIVRALEVIEITKEPYSATLPNALPALTPDLRIGLTRSRADLDERVTFRVEQMWQQGFVSEVESLIRIGLKDGVTASRALGYAQIIDYLDGEISEDEAKSETIRLTKRFVRKQESWFRRDPAVIWVEADSPNLVEIVLNMVNELR